MVKTQQQETEMEKVLYETFLACKTAEDVKALLEDLCTYTETEQMAQRAKAAQLLKAGKTYTEVIAATNISSAIDGKRRMFAVFSAFPLGGRWMKRSFRRMRGSSV